MKTRIRSKLAHNLTSQEATACRQLTFGQDGTMADELTWAREERDGSRVFLLEDEDGELLAWAGLWQSGTFTLEAHFYTRKNWRRKGFATRLARRVFGHADAAPTVEYHDPASANFFKSLGREVTVSSRSSIDL